MFAAAPCHGFGFDEIGFLRREAGAFVRAITERLGFGVAAGAEIETAGFHRQHEGRFLGDGGFTHAPVVTAHRALAN